MRLTGKARGAALLTASSFFFASMSLFVRLSGDLPLFQKAIFRNLIALIVSVSVIRSRRIPLRVPRGTALPLWLRVTAGTGAVLCNFYAVSRLALASSSALSRLGPFFAIIFAAVFLRERVTRGERGCIGVALLGSLFLIVPEMDTLGVPALVGLTGGVLTGIVHSSLRAIRRHPELDGNVVVFYFCLVSFAVTVIPCIFSWSAITPAQIAVLFLAGVFSALGQYALTAAYRYAAPKDISICDCSQIVFSAVFGLAFFRQIPTAEESIGYALIILASVILFILYRPRKAPAGTAVPSEDLKT